MNYPIWDIPGIIGGIVIGMNAIFHVFVSHMAVGLGLFIIFAEYKARKENNTAILKALKKTSFTGFLLFSFTIGALGGVGIWTTIGLVSPEATSMLIHNYVWGWAVEWVFFILEVFAGYLYFYSWDRVDDKTHRRIGLIYGISAWLSMVIINGILTFMLTRGNWEPNIGLNNFWLGFFNQTYWPSLLMRTTAALAIAAIVVSILSHIYLKDEAEKASVIQYSGKFFYPMILMPVFFGWWFMVIPQRSRDYIIGVSPLMNLFFMVSIGLSIVVVFFAYIAMIRKPKEATLTSLIVIALLTLGTILGAEFVREGVRKPFTIDETLYANQIYVKDAVNMRQKKESILLYSKWALTPFVTPENKLIAGHEIFKIECRMCHSVDGMNGIKGLTKNWKVEHAEYVIENLNIIKEFMPVFVGTAEEKKALAEWIISLNKKDEKGGK